MESRPPFLLLQERKVVAVQVIYGGANIMLNNYRTVLNKLYQSQLNRETPITPPTLRIPPSIRYTIIYYTKRYTHVYKW